MKQEKVYYIIELLYQYAQSKNIKVKTSKCAPLELHFKVTYDWWAADISRIPHFCYV